ncbi:hypothetical protein M378DRAFT_80117 [Amanita muscaria Koide BX008]|uniref:Uncharacterized protein n=1 Tax=Amanita muscaria (strain Koide BX008) TaxID=946122 RepID=A0A0C2X1Y9_AMAMK|nr:hypothetical protein M378DRAFT_80117 [Amanita muscaria Koide BX008]
MDAGKLEEDAKLQRAVAKEDVRENQVEVFEDYADEYEAVASLSKPPKPSVLEIIDSTLPEKLPLPSTDNSSIFEDESSSEYNVIALSSCSKHTLNDAVLVLLAEEKYEEAYKVLVEMKQLEHEIHAHMAYESAALLTLDDMHRSSTGLGTVSEHVARFETFFSLIPSSRVSDGNRTFTDIRKRILDNPLINMDLTIRFSLILVKKGYVNLVQKYTIPLIARFASSDVCLQFVDDVIVMNKRFWHSQELPDRRNAIIQSWNLRSTAIHWLAFSNRIEEAISLLPRDGSPMDGFRLSRQTHALLRFHLARSSRPKQRDLIGYVDSLLLEPEYSHVSREADDATDPFIHTAGSPSQDVDVVLSHFQPVSSSHSPNLVTSLRRLKNAYTSSSAIDSLFMIPPPLEEVLGFFASYQAHLGKNGRAIALLRRRVLRLGRGLASHFLFAEMLHYYRVDQPGLVLETYLDHFYISAIPRDDVLALHDAFRRSRDAKLQASKTGDINLQFRMGMQGVEPSLAQTRLWPTTSHTSLVWHALVALTEDDRAFLQLYQKLLQISREGYSSLSANPHSEEAYNTTLVPPPTWDANVPAAAFTPFIRRMLKTSNATTAGSLGALLLGDMVRAGIEPNRHHLTEIAQFYAQHRDSRRAFMIMDRMEAAEEEQRELTSPSSHCDTRSTASPRSSSAPDIVFYCALLRSFIQTHDLKASEKVASRITSRYKTELESNAFSSAQHEVLEALWRDFAQLREANDKATDCDQRTSGISVSKFRLFR